MQTENISLNLKHVT